MMSVLQLQLSLSYFHNKPNFVSHKPKLKVISQNSPQSQDNQTTEKPTPPSGLGFGPPAQQPKPTSGKKGRRERDNIIRRSPVGKPAFLSKENDDVGVKKEESLSETAFVVVWLGLGGLIFVEGIALASSGFLPEEWDKFFVKVVYPAFTPTVFLFVAASVVYGVFKYFQNENAKTPK